MSSFLSPTLPGKPEGKVDDHTNMSPIVTSPSHKQIPLDTHRSLNHMSSHPFGGRTTSTTAKGLLFHSAQGKMAVLSLAPKGSPTSAVHAST